MSFAPFPHSSDARVPGSRGEEFILACAEKTGISPAEKLEDPELDQAFQGVLAYWRSKPDDPEPEVPPSEALKAWKSRACYFDVDGHRLGGWSEGQGEPLLLVHGYPTASFDWVRVWPELASRFRVYALDLLGYGFSDKPEDAAYTTFAQADRLVAWVLAQGLEETLVLAHDLGDTVVQELLARQLEETLPFRIRRVVFLNGGLFPETHFARPVQRLYLSKVGPLVACLTDGGFMTRGIRATLGKDAQSDLEMLNDLWLLIHENQGERLLPAQYGYIQERRDHRERWVGALARTEVPFTLVNGSADPISGDHVVTRYHELLPDAPFVRLPEIGHWPALEAPRSVLEATLRFFGNI
jgi:pimeloyl-ACP methyl ester carboxylesterase